MVDYVLVAAIIPVILKILQQAGTALRLRDLEVLVRADKKWEGADTFDIRDAVHELVAAGKAQFDQPGYKVRLKDSAAPPEGPAAAAKEGASGEARP